ncbi:hypothetical protein E5163_00660 [Marinicauda algicola]|uniref:Uncharacterized protein n=1 Tax=Marinicauda algicola TaxID=2029849 RepID=A0A4S2H2D7_9PROT|nr:hypothetical protein [Marinicauda algicola]TGY89686.1 hypothetical protein E5163_00660 [Marinicauda algicola]
MQIIQSVLDYLRLGFAEVNAVQGLVIALVAALLLPGWRRIPVFALGATVVHLLADVLAPVFANGAALRLPPLLYVGFWEHVLILILGYLVVISVLAAIKRLIFKR